MIHVVGMPARSLQKARAMLHHTVKANMDHATFIHMAAPIRETYAYLMDDKTMAEEIDRTLVACVRSRLPVYIYVPADTVAVQLDASRLDSPLDTSVRNKDNKVEDHVVKSVLSLIKKASSPAILADVLGMRHGGRELIRKLADLTHFSSYSTPLSKGVIDENRPYYNGVYNGRGNSSACGCVSCTLTQRKFRFRAWPTPSNPQILS